MTTQQAFALALEQHQAGRLGDAEALYRQILAAQPNHADARHLLGVVAHQLGRPDLAVEWIRAALALDPNNSAAHSNLGEAYRQSGRLEDAMASYRRALDLKPDDPEAWYNLGNVLRERGELKEATFAYQHALQFKPGDPDLHNNLGITLAAQARYDEAIASYSRALSLKPDYAKVHSNLGNALKDQGQFGQAVTAYRRALELRPDVAEVHSNLGNALKDDGHLGEAIAAHRRALELKPDYAPAYNNLANALKDQGQLDEAVASYRIALQLQPDYAEAHSNLIYTLHLHPGEESSALSEEYKCWNRQFSEPGKRLFRPHANSPYPERKLKIGYVSPDFRFHSVSFFLTPLLEAHDHQECEIYCYANVRRPDAMTERMRRSVDVWRDVRALPDATFAECVQNDGIDILVDLAMHTAENRLPVFARQPAPVQISWLAYPGTTGLEAIHYRLTDRFIDPPEADDTGTGEQALRLPDSWCCYAPVAEFPPVEPLPAAHMELVTFGSLNQFAKINEDLIRCWARLLQEVPKSRLLMIGPGGHAEERTRQCFVTCGVDAARVEFFPFSSWPDYTRLFARIDIALDAHPCNGMTTTCHALWMGVPVVTRVGTSAVSRAGSSLLHTIGLSEWVAQSEDDYLRIAATWANDLPHLAELRETLRARMQASPLMDTSRFARNIETAYRTAWRHWCGKNISLSEGPVQSPRSPQL